MQHTTRLLIFLLILSCACTPRKPAIKQEKNKPLNLVVVLDLSDRLTIPGQINRDTILLHHIYRVFEQQVRSQSYINSQDQLQVLVAPQKNQPASVEAIENKLRVSMRELPIKEKVSFLKKNEPVFVQYIDSLYTSASGRPASSFSGADLWKFFDQYLKNYLVGDTGTRNTVVVLTDGYFDFESLKDKKQEGCRYSYSEKIMQQARDQNGDFEQLFKECGLLPVPLNRHNVKIIIAEMTPKVTYAREEELLSALWQNWINTMHVPLSIIIKKTELEEVKRQLSSFAH